jgi:superfamily II DNA/RNA helicase
VSDKVEEKTARMGELLSEGTSNALLSLVDECLSSIESVETDAKLDAAKKLVESIRSSQHKDLLRFSVQTSFAVTATYVALAIREMGLPVYKMTGLIPEGDRRSALDRFRETGGVLVCTDATAEGTNFPDVLHVLHYDLPTSRSKFELRKGHFDRYGRISPCKMYVFRDESGVLADETRLFETLMQDEIFSDGLRSGDEAAKQEDG